MPWHLRCLKKPSLHGRSSPRLPRHLLHVAKQQAIFGDDDEAIQKIWVG